MRQTSTTKPTERDIQDGSRYELDRLTYVTYRPFGMPLRIYETASVKAGQIALCDPTKAPLTVQLPAVGEGQFILGTIVVIKNHSDSTNAITALAAGEDTIDGAATLAITTARGNAVLLAMPGGWITI